MRAFAFAAALCAATTVSPAVAANEPALVSTVVEDVSDPGAIIVTDSGGATLWSSPVGLDPDVAVSTRLGTVWVFETLDLPTQIGNLGQVRALDLMTGEELARAALPNRLLGTLPPSASDAVLSPNGSALFIPQMVPSPPSDIYTLSILDPITMRSVGRVSLPPCPGLALVPGDEEAAILCPANSTLLRVVEEGGAWSLGTVATLGSAAGAPLAIARLADGSLAVLTRKEQLLRLDRDGNVLATLDLAVPKRAAAPHALAVSPDGNTIFAGLAEAQPRSAYGFFEVVTVDVESWSVVTSGSLNQPIWSMSAGADGTLLGVDRTGGRVVNLDPTTLFQVGETPIEAGVSVAISLGSIEP